MTTTQTYLDTVYDDPTTVIEILQSYTIHQTGREDEGSALRRQQVHRPADARATTRSPNNWPSDWQRVPPYRAASRSHRVSDRAAGLDYAEGTIVMAMFTGVWLTGVSEAQTIECDKTKTNLDLLP